MTFVLIAEHLSNYTSISNSNLTGWYCLDKTATELCLSQQHPHLRVVLHITQTITNSALLNITPATVNTLFRLSDYIITSRQWLATWAFLFLGLGTTATAPGIDLMVRDELEKDDCTKCQRTQRESCNTATRDVESSHRKQMLTLRLVNRHNHVLVW